MQITCGRTDHIVLFDSHIMRFMPPISINTDQVDEALEIIEGGIKLAQEKTG